LASRGEIGEPCPDPQPRPHQFQHPPIRHPPGHQGHQGGMIDLPETVADIGIQHPLPSPVGPDPDGLAGLLGRAFGTEPVADRQEVGLQDRFKDQLGCCHRYPVAHGRDAERPGLARLARLGDVHPSQRRRPVGPGPQVRGELLQEGRHPGRLNGLDGYPINAWRPSVGTDVPPCPPQDVAAGDLVVEGMETTARILLGTAVQHALQGTGRIQAIGLRGGPSPHRALTDPSLPAPAPMTQGPFARAGLCCPGRRHYYDPLRLPLGCPPLPVRRL
jgi:hypothetical protein